MDKRKLIIDCDPGHDDAVMLILALLDEKFDVLAIEASSGNQSIDKTSTNIINMCCFLNKENIPVVKGSTHPVVSEPRLCPEIHGESGLDGYIFPHYEKKALEVNGILYLRDLILKQDKVTLIITGPTTNIGLLLRVAPEVKSHIEEIVIMGGSTTDGNITPAAEFNILVDPEACDIIFNSGLKVKMIGLNITRQVLITNEVISRMEKLNTKCSDLFVKLAKVFNENQNKTFGIKFGPLHDPVTVASLIDSSLVDYKLMRVDVDLNHGDSYGRTNCDLFNRSIKTPNVEVGLNINVDKFWDIIENHLKRI